jgi:hydroxymethylpyrimidine pyrophosphatase-like HAD family hydrolase/fructoselysine-6-P-deglycase FrlB-like protein
LGKPYKIELQNLKDNYKFALNAPIEKLCSFIKASHNLPLIAVGSGGSLTAANMAVLLHQRTGMLSKSITPLELIYSEKSIRNASLLILSAGGNNSDIISAFRFAVIREPRQLMALCMRSQSKLASISKEYRYSQYLGFDLPSEKDGFLATNSLLASITILIRAYKESFFESYILPDNLDSAEEIQEQLIDLTQPILNKETWVVLYGRWGLPAAIDIESKFTEAALGHVQFTDYRNFAHGRHHWLAKRGNTTGVLALITPDEMKIAEKTLRLLPENIQPIRLVTEQSGPVGGLDLLVKMLNLVNLVGNAKGIDPGRPGVPTFGRQIYNLRISFDKSQKTLLQGVDNRRAIAIARKSRSLSLTDMGKEDIEYWEKSYRTYIRKLERTSFGSAVFDYDGTLCDPNERYIGPPQEITREIIRLLSEGIIIGVATGRGKSVREDLQRVIPAKYWEQILIGYYNGSDIALLTDKNQPNKTGILHIDLRVIKDRLESNEIFCRIAEFECRPTQITVEPKNIVFWDKTKAILLDIISKELGLKISVFESSHSIDIIAPGVSKMNLVLACEELAKRAGKPGIALCIGDKGEWPGNDYELLSAPYSISVDSVSTDPLSCWNLSQPGHRGVQATLDYLQSLNTLNSNSFTFSLKRRR